MKPLNHFNNMSNEISEFGKRFIEYADPELERVEAEEESAGFVFAQNMGDGVQVLAKLYCDDEVRAAIIGTMFNAMAPENQEVMLERLEDSLNSSSTPTPTPIPDKPKDF